MAVPFSNTKLRVPQGFQTLLEMLSREVLRDQPKNVYEFAADYLDGLVARRVQGQDRIFGLCMHQNPGFKK
ncbi:unnamed protein product [Brachionus calyciflorus]|uniref:RIIa domain-containing protein n=1 Tax=Brachionus calyciflorus TaxID=104777 RepID=A0A813MAY5_9BILA|nr:unnamed protein product [Brachionus calyciflorus]